MKFYVYFFEKKIRKTCICHNAMQELEKDVERNKRITPLIQKLPFPISVYKCYTFHQMFQHVQLL